MTTPKFATAINCMDGRAQQPVADWLKAICHVDYVDVITEAGPNLAILDGTVDQVERIRRLVSLSVTAHASTIVALVGHGQCAGNPAPKAEGIRQTRAGLDIIRSWGLPVTVIGLWVDGDTWQVEPLPAVERDDRRSE